MIALILYIYVSLVLDKNGAACKTVTLKRCPAIRRSSKLFWNVAGCVMQICLTSLWSPNHSEVPGSLILCFVTKKLLCAHLCLRWTWEVCFQVTKLLAAPPWFGSLLLGVLGFPGAVMLSPTGSSGHGASLNLLSWSLWKNEFSPLTGLPWKESAHLRGEL